MLEHLDWIEEWFGPMKESVMDAECFLHLSPMLQIEFLAFFDGRAWRTYEQRRRASLPEVEEPSLSVGSKEESDAYENWRASALRNLAPDARHKFLVMFAAASGLDFGSIFAELKKLAEGGEFIFRNIWKIIDPMQIGGYAEDLARKRRNLENLEKLLTDPGGALSDSERKLIVQVTRDVAASRAYPFPKLAGLD
jgi:hypothetical protein